MPNKFLVADVVSRELDRGRSRGRPDADILEELVAEKLIEIVNLDEAAEANFERLVIGPAAETLDDGEAGTIAYAAGAGITAVIDERKAIRLCEKFFPKLQIVCTVDILFHAEVRRTLGDGFLADAVFRALKNGRMRVLPQHVKSVVDLIGAARAAECHSLPKLAREMRRSVSTMDATQQE
jgi:predicted nucleic acid-binding protein